MKRLMIKAAGIGCLGLPLSSFAMTVQYFGLTTEPPIQSTKTALVCLLDKGDQIKSAMNQDLKMQMKTQPMSASEITERYATQFRSLSKKVICQFEAAKLGVTRLPAIVINHQYVIYGQQNIDSAIREYQAFLEREHVE